VGEALPVTALVGEQEKNRSAAPGGPRAQSESVTQGEGYAAPNRAIRPKVLFLDHVGVLGGAELNLIDMVRAGGPGNHVILMNHGPLVSALESTGIGVTVLPAMTSFSGCRRRGGIFSALKAVPQVLSLARAVSKRAADFDLIWANSQKSFVVGCFAAALSGRPLVWHLRDILSSEHFSFINRKIAVMLANRFATKVITVSKAGLASFQDSGGRLGLGTVVYNGIDPKPFDDSHFRENREKLCQEFPIGDAPVVGLFGRLTSWKGQHVLIRALQSLPGVHAIVVGSALFSEDTYADSLRGLATELGVADRIHFTGFRRDIPQLISAVNIVVHTSTAPEPFGRVIVEAMLARRPVIATNAGGAAEIIVDGQNGILTPLSDPQALANAIRGLLEEPERAVALANAGYETAVKDFSLASFLRNIETVKNGLMIPRPGTAQRPV